MFQLRWLWKNMLGFRKRYVFALFSTVLLSVLSLGNSLITAQIMDGIFYPIQETGMVPPDGMRSLGLLVALLIGFTLLRTAFGYGSVITYETCSQKLIYKLRRDLYGNMQIQDAIFFSRNRTGDLMTRLTGDMDMIRHAVCWVMRMTIDSVMLFLAASITFLIVDWLFALSLLIVTPVIYIFTQLFARKAPPLYRDIREKLSQLNTAAQENIAGNRVVKAFAREEYEKARFEVKNREYMEANIKAPMLWLKFAPFIEGLSQALSVTVLLVGGIFLINGRITIGQFTLFNSLCWMLTNPMRMIGMLINDFQRFFASAGKIVELFYARSTIASRQDAKKVETRLKGAVEFQNISLKLGKAKVLRDISLRIEPGETVAIMGPTGSGKTTLIGLIPRLMDVSAGQVLIDGTPVGLYDLHDLRSGIGIATQDVFLFSDSIDGNIAYGDTALTEEEVKEIARKAAVDFTDKMAEGFDTVIGERGTGLSGGQKQRIALARALAVKPSILILDDTTSAVDMETEKYIQQQLRELDFACTKIIIAQRISTTKEADKIVILDGGQIVDIGTHEELIERPGYYREVYRLQNGLDEAEAV